MSDSGFDLGLDDPARAGVFLITHDDLAPLATAARDAGLRATRIDLQDCRDKSTLLLRIATALDFPAGLGRNWDGLADCLQDLSWLPAAGHALLLGHAGDLRRDREADFDTLLDILDEASRSWAGAQRPFWAFVSLAEEDFEAME
ncbi:barstar family protein [Pseudoxanthomonas mexicana]|uniref:barstar family protein n=1 Tax=Pseudoxanthomonas mexicana TaxID=128785 RepID=UPI00398B2896